MDKSRAEYWMHEALEEARRAADEGEVPVGAVMLVNEKIVARGHNRSIRTHDPTAHAEILALRHAAHSMRNYRLPGSILVVTVEPCVMCTGALVHARVDEIIYGATDPKGGAIESCFRLADSEHLNHHIETTGGILVDECASLLKDFFALRRT
jgi:tRNA(adenine34) deaminase